MTRRIVLFELNEVPFRIIEEFCRWRPGSTLARTFERCRRFRTHAETSGHLSPWTTWPTLHRGVSAEKHGISEFGQSLAEVDGAYPPLYRLLAERGIPTGVFGSLHSYPPPNVRAGYRFFVPDTFAAGSECFPEALVPAQEFTLRMVRASARNVDRSVPMGLALRLLAAAPGLGLKPRTLLDFGVQLASERMRTARRVRRRSNQAVLAFDMFMKQLDTTRPAFATFFTNHVASAMHRFWAARFPEDYQDFRLDREWTATYRDEIDFAMCRFDRFFARLVKFTDRNPEYALWVAGSMGQAAALAEPVETQLFVTDPGRFTAALGLALADWVPVPTMFPQFNLRVTGGQAAAFRARLAGLLIQEAALKFRQPERNLFCLDFGHANLNRAPGTRIVFDGRPAALDELGLSHVEIEDKSGTTAYHVPEGVLFIYDPVGGAPGPAAAPELSTLEIAPSILRNFGVPVPAYMRKPGHALSA